MAADLVPVVDDGLGNNTWIVELGDGRALVVDASANCARYTPTRRNAA